jgi:hypothetical protein
MPPDSNFHFTARLWGLFFTLKLVYGFQIHRA